MKSNDDCKPNDDNGDEFNGPNLQKHMVPEADGFAPLKLPRMKSKSDTDKNSCVRWLPAKMVSIDPRLSHIKNTLKCQSRNAHVSQRVAHIALKLQKEHSEAK